ncbi:hypothetical protein QZH41_010441 [Actinostola sp. cb2023]|nr:hypothetical protein QZH41_010441 [Actinostola sp. cb2023]
MSAEEDTELRDLVAQSLESKGVLGKIRAQLRASVFLVLDEQDDAENKIPLSSPNLKRFLSTTEGRLVTGLVREFLEFFDLDFTIAVFDPESSFSDRYQGRNNLANELNLHDTDKFSSKPLLLEVIQRMLQGGNTTTGKHPPSTNDTQPQAKNTSWQNGSVSPRSSSPSSVGKEEDDHSHSELMISAGFESDDDRKPSKIPQRIKDDRPRSTTHSHASENGLDHFGDDKLDSKEKTLSDSRKEQSGRGSPDRTLGSDDDDDIFAEFMLQQTILSNKQDKQRVSYVLFNKLILTGGSTWRRVGGGGGGGDDDGDDYDCDDGDGNDDGNDDDDGCDCNDDDDDGCDGNDDDDDGNDGQRPKADFMHLFFTGPKSAGVLASLKGAPSLSGGSGLGSLKDAPPLPGTTKSTAHKDIIKSPNWNDLADIDNRINKLGFDIPGEDKSTNLQDYDYEDDFQPSSSHLSEHSLTDEIEEQLSSYHSNSSKVDDPLTTDRTVSRASDSGLDYAEDILDDF